MQRKARGRARKPKDPKIVRGVPPTGLLSSDLGLSSGVVTVLGDPTTDHLRQSSIKE